MTKYSWDGHILAKPNKKLVAYDALLIITVLSRVNSNDYECVQGIYAKKNSWGRGDQSSLGLKNTVH